MAKVDAELASLVDLRATPNPVPPGAMILQPSDARRRSGSHYTPRSLTGPIVRKTLEPLDSFGRNGIAPGEFYVMHHMNVDSKGNLYVTEVQDGKRVQKITFKGLVPAAVKR